MANSVLGMAQISDGKPIRLVDNGDGTFSLGVSLVGGGGGGGTPGGTSGQVQFNNAGSFGGFGLWDVINSMLALGGNPITPFQGLYVGPDESTLNAYIQGFIGPQHVAITDIVDPSVQGGAVFGVSCQSDLSVDNIWGIETVVLGVLSSDQPRSINGAEITVAAIGTGSIALLSGLEIQMDWSSLGNLQDFQGLIVDTPFIGGGGTIGTNTAILIRDQLGATSNYAFKSGAGMLEVGDATKAAGIHVQGAGAFDVDGSGDKTQIWSDSDDESNYGLVLTNRTAGIAHFASIYASDTPGSLSIGADGDSAHLIYRATISQWAFDKSLQVSSWISTLRNTAPADGDIAANELADWYNPANGAAFAMFKSKTADGTVVAAGFGMNTVAAPSPSTIVLPTSVYGGSAQLLGGPTAWKSEIINGTTYKIPLY